MLNKEQTDMLFQQNAVLIGEVDGMPRYRAVELFGEEAVDYVMGRDLRNGYYNVYHIKGCGTCYLTCKGFRAAATYVNLREIRDLEA